MRKKAPVKQQHKGGRVAQSKEVVSKPQAQVPVQHQAGGFFSQITSRDISIPKILPLHYISAKVKDKNIEAKAGELRDTISNELFGDTEHPFEFMVLGVQKWWVEVKAKGNEFIQRYPVTPHNEQLPFEEDAKGIKRIYTYEYFVMLPKKIETEGSHIPYVLSFRNTSVRAGKNLATKIFELEYAQKRPWELVFELSNKEQSNDKGDFFVQTVTPKRKATTEEKDIAEKWFHLMNTQAVNIKVDHSDLENINQDMDQVNSDKF